MGAAHYTDFNQMFAQENLDIVSITTWQSVRLEPTLAAAEAGLAGIIAEKPISASVGEANDMIEACDKNGTKLVVGHQRRFSPQNSEAHETKKAKRKKRKKNKKNKKKKTEKKEKKTRI